MLDNVDFKHAKVIVELGPGTGVITREIIKEMLPSCKLLIFELHRPFYEELKKEFAKNDQVILVHDSAEFLEKHLEAFHLGKVDAVVSSLPLANFKKSLLNNLISAVKESLEHDGKFIQFQYTLKTKKLLNEYFPIIQTSFTSRNLPPAFIYTCSKK